MDQDYERRLLRQINIQNENTMPGVTEMRRTLTPSNSPMSSPSKHGDRFIPSRAGANWSINFHRINENEKSPSQNRKAKDATSDNGKDGLAYSALLKNELLGAGIEKVQDPQTEDRRLQPSTPEKKSLFTVISACPSFQTRCLALVSTWEDPAFCKNVDLDCKTEKSEILKKPEPN
uniref:Fizzy and cell division cycle 20 related 1 n=1 Tax=Ornithorhynchus anatinus TaxID=9258 RepID=K7ECR7_ORNAN